MLRGVVERVPRVRKSVSATTRARALCEVPGDEYTFLTEGEFSRMVEDDAFLEWASVHGHRYGTPEAWVDEQTAGGTDVVLEIDVQGGMQVAEKRPDACLIFISPPSMEELRRRIRGRKRDQEADIRRRLKEAEREMELCSHYHHNVVNGDLDRAVDEVCQIVLAEREGRAEK